MRLFRRRPKLVLLADGVEVSYRLNSPVRATFHKAMLVSLWSSFLLLLPEVCSLWFGGIIASGCCVRAMARWLDRVAGWEDGDIPAVWDEMDDDAG